MSYRSKCYALCSCIIALAVSFDVRTVATGYGIGHELQLGLKIGCMADISRATLDTISYTSLWKGPRVYLVHVVCEV